MPTPPRTARSTRLDPARDGRGSRSPAPEPDDRTPVRTRPRYTAPATSHQGYDGAWGERSGRTRGPVVRGVADEVVGRTRDVGGGAVQPRAGQVGEGVAVPEADDRDALHQQRVHRDHDEDQR